MNREIKFRGKTPEGKWVYGDLIHVTKDFKQIVQILHWTGDHPSEYASEVIPETVGQYTGLKDKNGVEIYEGDKLQYHQYDEFIVSWDNTFLGFSINGSATKSLVIGTIYDKESEVNHG